MEKIYYKSFEKSLFSKNDSYKYEKRELIFYSPLNVFSVCPRPLNPVSR